MNLKNMWKKVAVTALSLTIAVSGIGAMGSKATVYAAEAGIAQKYESLFEGDKIINVNVTIADDDWESILASPLDKDYKKVTVDVDGNVLSNVGFSTKGNLTLKAVASMTDSDRYSFRLKFDKYDKEQTLLGLDKMVLNNSYADPSFLREYLHYEALRSIGLDAPLTVFTNLYINGELYGFYIGVEAIDDSYMERNYGEDYNDGVLYDTDEKSYLQYEEDGEYETLTYELGTEDDKASLKNFISVLNDMPAGEKGDIEDVLDVDSALKYIAGNAVLGNYDSYNGDKGHNYMLYGDADGKFSVLPWDFNMSFNGYSGGGGGRNTAAAGTTTSTTTTSTTTTVTNTNATTASVDVPVMGISLDSVPMIGNLLEVPEYKAKYLTYVNELVDYLGGIENRITELAAIIRPSVTADPTKFYTVEQFESNVAYSATGDAAGGMQGGGAMEGMTPPDDAGMTPPTMPDGTSAARPDNAGAATGSTSDTTSTGTAGQVPGQGGGQGQGGQGGQGMRTMAAGSLMTFALNRLASLQEQLGLAVTPLPATTATTTPATAAGAISVLLNGSKVSFDNQEPVNQSGRVLVPLRGIFEAFGAEVKWDAATKKITAVKDDRTVTLTIGSTTAYVNGTAVTLDVPASVVNGRTLVPVRFISEGLDMDAAWDAATATVRIASKS
ncbi:CotH kinase family protein [Paenibacillus sp. KS-LC4]|uniref:CotH kinase family protein n=1 Tax=Paenibacillus sp. KS-LC4 TaxID=2979727 RepID=UPI0030CF8DE5